MATIIGNHGTKEVARAPSARPEQCRRGLLPKGRGVAALAGALVLLAGTPVAAGQAAGKTERVSVSTGGRQADGSSQRPTLSVDGRFVAFVSGATNLVPGDTNGVFDVFVRDRRTGTTGRVSIGPGGDQGNDHSFGRRRCRQTVATSPSTPTPPTWCRATPTASTTCSSTTGEPGTTERVSVGRGRHPGQQRRSFLPALSADGRFVAFESRRHQPGAGRHQRLRATSSSATGRRAGPIGSAWVRTAARATAEPGSGALGRRPLRRLPLLRQQPGPGRHQRRGRRLRPRSADRAHPAGQRGRGRRPRRLPQRKPGALGQRPLRRLPLLREQPGAGRHQRRGRRLRSGPASGAHRTGQPGRGGAQGNGDSVHPSISPGGRFVGFESLASNLVPGDTNGTYDVFLHDRQAGTTERVSLGRRGEQALQGAGGGAASAGGRHVAFETIAANLVPGDTNDRVDVFVRTR